MIERPKGKRISRYKKAGEEAATRIFDLTPMNEKQRLYIDALKTHDQTIVCGYSGCKTGDTIIKYNRGKRVGVRKITLENFVKKFNKEPGVKAPFKADVDTFVHSYNVETGNIELNKVEGAWRTGVKEVLKITTDTAGFVKITKDDKVLLEDGTFKVAKEVVVGDRLLCKGDFKCPKTDRAKKRKTSKLRVTVEGLRYYEGGWGKKTHCKIVGKTYYYKRCHRARLVVEADMNGVDYNTYVLALRKDPNHTYRKILDGSIEVHHKDGDVTNDTLDNLELLSQEAHAKLHYEERGQEGFGRVYKKISTVVSVEDLGEMEVFDLTMKAPNHNFVVNDGIITHNTGKTFIAATMAANMYLTGQVERLVLTRPNVSVGKDLGYFPGDINEKFGPWAAPVVDVLQERLGKGKLETDIKNGNIELAPMSVMRGRSFKNSFVILDEAQNTTIPEMKMFLTRIGEGTKVVINGDVKQSDIKEQSGLSKIIHLAKKHQMDIPVIEFGIDDIVRSNICKAWLIAFESEKL
jgi:phosphate starvation-inducible protein PhoH and related proteins